MLSAEEARQLSTDSLSDAFDQAMEDISKIINDYVKEGLFRVSFEVKNDEIVQDLYANLESLVIRLLLLMVFVTYYQFHGGEQ